MAEKEEKKEDKHKEFKDLEKRLREATRDQKRFATVANQAYANYISEISKDKPDFDIAKYTFSDEHAKGLAKKVMDKLSDHIIKRYKLGKDIDKEALKDMISLYTGHSEDDLAKQFEGKVVDSTYFDKNVKDTMIDHHGQHVQSKVQTSLRNAHQTPSKKDNLYEFLNKKLTKSGYELDTKKLNDQKVISTFLELQAGAPNEEYHLERKHIKPKEGHPDYKPK